MSEFYMKCAQVMSSFDSLRAVFLEYFPLVAEGKVYDIKTVDKQLQANVELVFMEAIEKRVAKIFDLSIEFFGEVIPRSNGEPWSYLSQYYLSLPCLKRLHELGLELDQINTVGGNFNATMLYGAALSGQTDMVKYLLEMGADPCIRAYDLDETPLEAAYTGNHLETAVLLANPTTVRLPLRITENLIEDSDSIYWGDILDLAEAENKTEFIQLFTSVLSNEV